MKRFGLAVSSLTLTILSSCSLLADIMPDYQMSKSLSDYGVPVFFTPKEACDWIYSNIRYESSKKLHTPEETLQSMTGDCDDMSLLLGYICQEQLGVASKLVVYESELAGDAVVFDYSHTILYVDPHYYDATSCQQFDRIEDGNRLLGEVQIDRALAEALLYHNLYLYMN